MHKSLIIREQANALRTPKKDDADGYNTIIKPRKDTLSLLRLVVKVENSKTWPKKQSTKIDHC